MAYSNGKPGCTWMGKYYPPVPVTEVHCDACAQAGAVPFEVYTCRHCGGAAQPIAPFACTTCGEAVRYHQERPWCWTPVGFDKAIDAMLCDTCGEPAASGRAWYDRQTEATKP